MPDSTAGGAAGTHPPSPDDTIDLPGLLAALAPWRWRLVMLPLAVGVLALGITYAIAPTFTARTVLLPPSGAGSQASAALASLGNLASLAGVGAVRTPADQLASLLQSATVEARLVERFELKKVYERELAGDARERLRAATRVSAGRKDGLITIEVDDHDPQRAAALANAYVEELRTLSASLAITEAQQRRVFFEQQLAATREKLTQAQTALEGSGFNVATLKSEPRTAAESYSRLRAEITTTEIRLQGLRRQLSDATPEVQQALTQLGTLRAQIARLDAAEGSAPRSDYIARYRDFKYQETLFELFSRQYELARIDESREGAFIQVVDTATPPERKSAPKRGRIAIAATFSAALLLLAGLLARELWRRETTRQRAARPSA